MCCQIKQRVTPLTCAFVPGCSFGWTCSSRVDVDTKVNTLSIKLQD
jgi:hypothetical protein